MRACECVCEHVCVCKISNRKVLVDARRRFYADDMLPMSCYTRCRMSLRRLHTPACTTHRRVVCLSVCLLCPHAYLKNQLQRIFCARCLWPCGSVLFWRRCNALCTSGFVDDVVFTTISVLYGISIIPYLKTWQKW